MTEKILVVDDEPVCVLFLSLYLKDHGYIVETAKDGSSAISIGEVFNPDVLITDWMLKDSYDGLDVAKKLSNSRSDLKIIFMTGMASDALQEKITDLKSYRIVEKPVDLESLVNFIKNWN